MKREIKHLIIGSMICAATMLLFLAFGNQLPNHVPVQITIDGSVGNTLPKPLFIFGLPIVFTAVNLAKGWSLIRKQGASIYSFYIIPGIAVLLSVAILWTALGFC
ncbi:MAG: DUF1648 domain-containing protein [Oscillospiraceae bacterium]|nr:DUF1648 domain-containing protein [Oscillospiraceae bacterium]